MTQTNVAESQRANCSPSKAHPTVTLSSYKAGGDPRDFPIASSRESQSLMIPDEILELYAFLFCQGRYRDLGMTFEHFLLVVTSVQRDHAFA